ncbi:MAG: dihydrodipicolinate synthase family protein [Anaerolineales bacterium]|jgi:4-hydroxy-tetrahydrodipicolinate synthase|nr:dihydrodipicolinate synthase family protein [Anaerolineales bacterium]
MIDRTMQGVYPILSMPFDSRARIDVEDLQREIEYLIESGIHGIGLAMASEIYKLSENERNVAITTIVEQVNHRVKVVINTSAPGTDTAILYSRTAQDLGADAIMVTPPFGIHSSIIKHYYKSISESINLPIFIQDTDSLPLDPDLLVQISLESHIECYAKIEAIPTSPRIAKTKELSDDTIRIFVGGTGDNFYVEELRAGSVGMMPGAILPEIFVRTWELHQRGLTDNISPQFSQYSSLLSILGQGHGISSYLTKEVLRLKGIFKAANARSPALKPDQKSYQKLAEMIEMLDV